MSIGNFTTIINGPCFTKRLPKRLAKRSPFFTAKAPLKNPPLPLLRFDSRLRHQPTLPEIKLLFFL